MLIALGYCTRDNTACRQLLEWIIELGGCKNHTCLLLHDHRVTPDGIDGTKNITNLAAQAFGGITPIVGKASIDGWPQGANYFFRTIASVLSYRKDVRFWLQMEPDSIPLKPGWAEQIESEFIACRKPFMGDRVEVGNIPLHMSGVALYPNPLHQFSGEAYRAADVAWDMAGKDEIVPQAHWTKLIEHAWQHPAFTDVSELRTQIRPEAVLFHASTDGSLINILREQKATPVWKGGNDPIHFTSPDGSERFKAGLGAVQFGAEAPRFSVGEGQELVAVDHLSVQQESPDTLALQKQNPGMAIDPRGRLDAPPFTCDIFIRTYPADYEWLGYCLQSISKYCTGFRKLWVISPQVTPQPEGSLQLADGTLLPVQWKQVNEETEDGYLAQQIHKLYADVITDYQPDYILHLDSDTLFTRPVTPMSFMDQQRQVTPLRPIWLYTDYKTIQTPWQPITEAFMDQPVQFEFMRRFPIMIPRWLYPKLREFCHRKHGRIISEYVRNQPNRAFSEFNALGAYAFKHHQDRFTWWNTEVTPLPLPVARQFYSWGGITPEVTQEINTILGLSLSQQRADQVNQVATTSGDGTPGVPRGGFGSHCPVGENSPLPGTAGPAVPSTVPSSPCAHGTNGEAVPAQIEVLPNDIWVLKDDTHISQWVKQQGRLDHDMNTLPFILPLIKPGDTVIDVGAFIGDHTVAYAGAVGPEGLVHAFEPNPDANKCLVHNMVNAHGLTNVAVYEMALGNRNRIISLDWNNGNAGGVYVRDTPGTVEMTRLDGYRFSKVDLIKWDIEGCEFDALSGAYETIMRCRPKMVMEINKVALERQGDTPDDIFRWLANHGYRWHIMQENVSAEDPMFDIICEPLPLPTNEEAPPETPTAADLYMSVSIHDHVRALANHMKKGKDAKKYVRKLLIREGLTQSTPKKKTYDKTQRKTEMQPNK